MSSDLSWGEVHRLWSIAKPPSSPPQIVDWWQPTSYDTWLRCFAAPTARRWKTAPELVEMYLGRNPPKSADRGRLALQKLPAFLQQLRRSIREDLDGSRNSYLLAATKAGHYESFQMLYSEHSARVAAYETLDRQIAQLIQIVSEALKQLDAGPAISISHGAAPPAPRNTAKRKRSAIASRTKRPRTKKTNVLRSRKTEADRRIR